MSVALLIEKGASVNAVTNYNHTPLHWASGKETVERKESVQLQLSQTPLHWASERIWKQSFY
jgi:hypothetical protein